MYIAAADMVKDLIQGPAGPAAPTQANAGMNDLGIKSSGVSGGSMQDAVAKSFSGLSDSLAATGGAKVAAPTATLSAPPTPLAGGAAPPTPEAPPPPTMTGQGFNQGAAASPSVMDTFAESEPDDPKNTPHNRTLAEVAGGEPPPMISAEGPMAPIAAPTSDSIPMIPIPEEAPSMTTVTPDAVNKDVTGGMDPLEMAALGSSLMSGIFKQGAAPPPPSVRGMQGPGMKPVFRR